MSNEIKLTASDVIDIRRSHLNGTPTAKISAEYGVSQRHVRRIVEGTRWSDIPADKIISKFNNYAVTYDGRVYSFNKNDYLATEIIRGKPHVNLHKVGKTGSERVRVAIDDLVKSHF
jgi:hypothetical protein